MVPRNRSNILFSRLDMHFGVYYGACWPNLSIKKTKKPHSKLQNAYFGDKKRYKDYSFLP
jgi:hypothetical protein